MQKDSDQTAAKHREIQRDVDAKDKSKGNGDGKDHAMQAGARVYPEPPMPAQHLQKPGKEADLNLQPMYDAPYYKGSGKLEGMTAIITGGDSGIGRSVAVLYAREGADIAALYVRRYGRAHREGVRPDRRAGKQCGVSDSHGRV
jgi:hypothetical protein